MKKILKKHTEEEDTEEEEEADTDMLHAEVDGVVYMNDEGFPDCEDDELDPAMKEMLR